MEKLTDIEIKINEGISLLEIAKNYCEAYYDRSQEITNLIIFLDVILSKQKELRNSLDNVI